MCAHACMGGRACVCVCVCPCVRVRARAREREGAIHVHARIAARCNALCNARCNALSNAPSNAPCNALSSAPCYDVTPGPLDARVHAAGHVGLRATRRRSLHGAAAPPVTARNRMCLGRQPYLPGPATVCTGACNRMHRGLQPYGPGPATVCVCVPVARPRRSCSAPVTLRSRFGHASVAPLRAGAVPCRAHRMPPFAPLCAESPGGRGSSHSKRPRGASPAGRTLPWPSRACWGWPAAWASSTELRRSSRLEIG